MDKKTYLVTGASKGIGRAIARSLANDGYQVILLARASDDLDSACVEIQLDSPTSFFTSSSKKCAKTKFSVFSSTLNRIGLGFHPSFFEPTKIAQQTHAITVGVRQHLKGCDLE